MNVLEIIFLIRRLGISDILDFPKDFRDSTSTRRWLQSVFRALDTLAGMTATKADDKVTDAVQKALANDQTWSVIHNLACDVADLKDIFTGKENPDIVASVNEAAENVGISPALVISIIQAIVTLFGFLKKKGA